MMTAPLLVWIVEDDEDDILLMQQAADRLPSPCHLTCFNDGAALLNQLAVPSELPHLLVINYNLMGMSGLEVTQQVRLISGCEQLPILWMSGEVDPFWEKVGQPLNVRWCWPKPFAFDTWQAFMQQICQQL